MINSYEELVQAVLTHEPDDLPSLLRSAGFRMYVDDWLAKNISWLLPHIDIIKIQPEYSKIVFTICGLEWRAYHDDAYYRTLRRKAETR